MMMMMMMLIIIMRVDVNPATEILLQAHFEKASSLLKVREKTPI